MNTAETKDTTIIENDMARECILHSARAVGRGRRPFAKASLVGTEQGDDTKGSVSFYYTPLGMLVCVALSGLKKERGVYTLSLVSGKENEVHVDRCTIPPLYAREGYAWCSALTGKLLPSDVRGKTVVIRESGSGSGRVAVGKITSIAI